MAVAAGIYFIVVLSVLHQVWYSSAKVRWCANGKVGERIENLTRYDDELQACMLCTNEDQLISLNELSQHECCKGDVARVGSCTAEDLLHACTPKAKCDNQRQCYDGWDEMGCFGCRNNTFSCRTEVEGTQCISIRKVCDSKKDCIDGKDETLCPYHGGWCDGFLCGDSHKRCIGYDKVCDSTKDCLDGSDEANCQYCPNQFRCRAFFREDINASSAECVGTFRVCNGKKECSNGADELGCHQWQDWSEWSKCGAETESCTRIRRRSCANKDYVVVSSSLCTKDVNDINENHVDICPECLAVGNLASITMERTVQNVYNVTPVLDETSWKLPFGTGALAGIIVASSLAFIGLVIAGGILALNLLGRTGFWRPSAKLPRPTSSNLPGVGNPNGNRVAPNRARNPYGDDEENGRTGHSSNSPSSNVPNRGASNTNIDNNSSIPAALNRAMPAGANGNANSLSTTLNRGASPALTDTNFPFSNIPNRGTTTTFTGMAIPGVRS